MLPFRRFGNVFLPEFENIFMEVLEIAKQLDLLNSNSGYLDGTKMKANASKHHAFSYGRAVELSGQFAKEIE
jgi:transposase